MDFTGRVAVVTGASSGLGRRIAIDLARAGATVVALARREQRLAELVEECRPFSERVTYQVCDLAHTEEFTEALAAVQSSHGRCDLLLNIAGIGGVIRNEAPSLAQAREVMQVNFLAPYAGMLAVLPGMCGRRGGVIANMSSDDARAPGPGAGDYSASKAALSAATESLSYDVRGQGVHLHVIYPGWVPTEMGLAAVREGGLRMPPRAVRRSEEQVSRLVLRRLGGARLDINAAALPLLAPLLRTVMPVRYQRMRAGR
ncbi:MAG: SDR family NAD(P)-dependent oxidoreductase [Mycobacteriales bacterium]